MTIFLLIRHGETDYVDEALAGRIDSPLNLEGMQQSQTVAQALKYLPIRAIYTSPLIRTQQTAEPLAKLLNLEIIVSHELNQVNFGDWQGLEFEDLIQDPNWRLFRENPGSVKIPGGEDSTMVRERVSKAILNLSQQYGEGEIIVIFSHGSIIRHTISFFIGLSLNDSNRIQIAPASISTLMVRDGSGKLLHLNQELPVNWL
jgi:broad specificity phosphatase PhoE